MDTFIRESIFWLQGHLSAEALTLWLFLVCVVAILALFRTYGVFGLYVYNALAIIFANIQVLRFTQYANFSEPVALGTVIFTTTYFVNDLITEHYGIEYAKKSVTLSFWTQILVILWMLLALGHPLPAADISTSEALSTAHSNYTAMLQLFTPSSRILIASLAAYICSQWLDILIFNRLSIMTKKKFVWFRQNAAMFVSGIVDTFIFSFLAWMLLSETSISWSELFFGYVLSSQVIRVILNISFTPFMYMSYNYAPNRTKVFI
jgi:uncharacterized integral membrane protein (TIGR00697 family)